MIFSKQTKEQKRLLREAKKSAPYAYEPFLEYASCLQTMAKPVAKKRLGLRLIVIADTHGILAYEKRFAAFLENVGNYDLCLLLGDVDCGDIRAILSAVPREKILAVRGNHDCMELGALGVRNLHKKAYTYKGVRFVGFEGAFKYNKGTFPCYTQHESICAIEKLPKRADVLLTHDRALSDPVADKAHPGLAGITKYLAENPVQWHLHGHVHKSYAAAYANGTAEKSVYLWELVEL